MFGRLALCFNNASRNKPYTVGKPAYSPFRLYHTCKEHAFEGWAAKLSVLVVSQKNVTNPYWVKQLILTLTVWWFGWFKFEETKTYWQLNIVFVWQTGDNMWMASPPHPDHQSGHTAVWGHSTISIYILEAVSGEARSVGATVVILEDGV